MHRISLPFQRLFTLSKRMHVRTRDAIYDRQLVYPHYVFMNRSRKLPTGAFLSCSIGCLLVPLSPLLCCCIHIDRLAFAIVSRYRLSPTKIWFHLPEGTQEPTGEWWERARKYVEIKYAKMKYQTSSGKILKLAAHQSDFLRLDLLIEHVTNIIIINSSVCVGHYHHAMCIS